MGSLADGLAPREREVLEHARLLAMDVDGVLTDGRVVWCGGTEIQRFHVHDGQGLAWLLRAGIEIAWISGRGSSATRRRAEELDVRELHLRAKDKEGVLAELQERLGIGPAETIAMGDDLPDLALARRAGLFVAPADARAEIRERAHVVTTARGGEGAVRELCELVLRARGSYAELTGLAVPESTGGP